MPDGQAPSGDKPDVEPPTGENGERPEIPSVEPPADIDISEVPSGEKPDGTVEPPSMEAQTITVTSSTVIKDAEGNVVTINDIKAGDFITIEQ